MAKQPTSEKLSRGEQELEKDAMKSREAEEKIREFSAAAERSLDGIMISDKDCPLLLDSGTPKPESVYIIRSRAFPITRLLSCFSGSLLSLHRSP